MGYDPSTHQTWIKIVGLPLQAWTTPEVTAFVRKFGHPLQILPFGAAAGHYRDIVVLVATKHPSHIPLAYMYREGEYSTQVDILILAWRVWEDNYFHPPEHYLPHEGPHNQLQLHDDHTVSVNHSSSSSSNNAPTEPTIDYSSWSPRSSCRQLERRKKWIPKLTPFCSSSRPITPPSTPMSQSSRSPSTGKTQHLCAPSNTNLSHLATKNPKFWHNTQWTSSILQICLLSFLSPVSIKPDLSRQPARLLHSTGGASQGSPITSPLCASPHLLPTQSMALALGDAFKTPNQMVQWAFLFMTRGPLKPSRFRLLSNLQPQLKLMGKLIPSHNGPLYLLHIFRPATIMPVLNEGRLLTPLRTRCSVLSHPLSPGTYSTHVTPSPLTHVTHPSLTPPIP